MVRGQQVHSAMNEFPLWLGASYFANFQAPIPNLSLPSLLTHRNETAQCSHTASFMHSYIANTIHILLTLINLFKNIQWLIGSLTRTQTHTHCSMQSSNAMNASIKNSHTHTHLMCTWRETEKERTRTCIHLHEAIYSLSHTHNMLTPFHGIGDAEKCKTEV